MPPPPPPPCALPITALFYIVIPRQSRRKGMNGKASSFSFSYRPKLSSLAGFSLFSQILLGVWGFFWWGCKIVVWRAHASPPKKKGSVVEGIKAPRRGRSRGWSRKERQSRAGSKQRRPKSERGRRNRKNEPKAKKKGRRTSSKKKRKTATERKERKSERQRQTKASPLPLSAHECSCKLATPQERKKRKTRCPLL